MFGRKASVAVRSLLPLLLGFGGWCLGVLIVLVALPTVPITDELLAVVSIAPPVALAVYTGWFRSAAPRERRGLRPPSPPPRSVRGSATRSRTRRASER